MDALLQIRHLRVCFPLGGTMAAVVDGVDLDVPAGRTLGLVGESGSGKTMTALSVLRLIPRPGQITDGRIGFAGRDLLRLDARSLRRMRGKEIAMIFQEPMTALNPLFTVGEQIAEVVRFHEGSGRHAARERAIEMLRLVEMPAPGERVDDYPHELSGGMRQRAMIAMALACRPQVLIADEPTTALDVTVQAQILDLLADLRGRLGMAVLLVTHDLGVVAERADQVAVMYAGRIVERGPASVVLQEPLHPYTRGLLRSVPGAGNERRRRLQTIPGTVPAPDALPSGCRFRDRCPIAVADCARIDPALNELRRAHAAACIRVEEA